MLVWAFLLACDGGETGDTDDTDVVDTDEPEDSDDTDVEVDYARISGVVRDADGNPVAGARVNVCRLVCQTSETDATGAYEMDELEPWTASYYVVPAEGSTLLPAIVTLTLAEGEDRAIDVTLFEPARAAMPDTAGWTEVVTDALWLEAGADSLEPPLFEELGEDLLAVPVPVEAAMPLEVDGEVLGVWYLGPFEATSDAGVAVKLTNTWGLAAGTVVEARVASLPDQFTWLDAGDLVVSEDGAHLVGGSLPVLTTLVLLEPSGG